MANSNQISADILEYWPNLKFAKTITSWQSSISYSCTVCKHVAESTATKLWNYGCRGCQILRTADRHRLSTKEYSERLEAIGWKLSEGEEYQTAKIAIWHTCPQEHKVHVTPYRVLRQGTCPDCLKADQQKKVDAYADFIWLNTNLTLLEDYIAGKVPITHKCGDCGRIWKIRPGDVVFGQRCRRCSYGKVSESLRLSREEVIRRVLAVSENTVTLHQDSEYINGKKHVKFQCLENSDHVWEGATGEFITGAKRCQFCYPYTQAHSASSIRWLESLAKESGTFIQHADNLGEFKIAGTKFRVDGYCKETNTVYEFHGNAFHGNPKLYQPKDKCHPYYRDVTAKELYAKTIAREELIKSLGFALVVIWESDFLELEREIGND